MAGEILSHLRQNPLAAGSRLGALGALAMTLLCGLAVVNSGEPSPRVGMILFYYPALLGVQILCAAAAFLLLPLAIGEPVPGHLNRR